MEGRLRTTLVLAAVVLATVASGGVAMGESIAADGSASVNDGVAAAGSVQADCSFPVTVTDVTGNDVTLEERPERIVTLQPSDSQIVWALNGSDRVVGMTQGPTTGYLDDTEGITDVKYAENGTTNVEVVTNLSADLVLAANVTDPANVEQLRSTGVPIYHFGGVSSMEETYRNINRTGELIGNCMAAAETVDSMQTRLDRIRTAVADEESPRALYLFYNYVAGDETHVDSMIEIAGGENVAANETGYYQISQEVVVANDPQWIVQPSGAPAPSGEAYNSTTAVREDQVLTVDANYANQAGPRVVRVVEEMAQAFHPEAFDENGEPIVETPTPTATATNDDSDETPTVEGTMTTDEATGTTTDANGPGFTAATVAIALVAATLLLARRRKGV